MPIKRDLASKAKQHNPAVLQEMDEMADRLGVGPRAAAVNAKRLRALLALEHDLTRDEQDELDALIIERQGDRWHGKHLGALVKRADSEWAERSGDPDFIAKWQRIAEANKTTNGKPNEPKSAHWVHVVLKSKEAKRIKRRMSRYYDIVHKLRAGIQKRAAARELPEVAKPVTAKVSIKPPSPYRAPTLPEADEMLTARPRRRKEVGVVAVYDQDGNRVA